MSVPCLFAQSKGGVICSPHPLASETGLRILRAGGTAIDAMLAASATLAAVYPHMTGIGGDALWLIHDGQVRTLVGIGQAGKRLPDTGSIGLRGPSAVATTAGALASWMRAQAISRGWGSRLNWQDLLEEAASLARAGVPLSASQAFWQTQRREVMEDLPDLMALCQKDGAWLREGDLLRQPDLANTFDHLIRHGLDDFYTGELAAAFSDVFNALGCGLDADDLARTRAYEVAPLEIRYRNGRYFNVAPPCQGLYTVQAMAALAQQPLEVLENGSALYYHRLVEAIKQGLVRRNAELHDPCADNWDYLSTLSRAAVRNYAALIDDSQAAPWSELGQPADTVWMAATDAQGRTACLIQSLFHDFGSGCVLGDTGVLWQNRAAGFSAIPGHPNAWAPGKRPAHTLNPSAYLADDGRQLFFGTQGGDGQPQTQMVVATQLIDYQASLESALRAPRFLLGRSFFDSTDNLKLEADIGEQVQASLADLGHEVEAIPALSPLAGLAGAICIEPNGERSAAYDPRSQGLALGE